MCGFRYWMFVVYYIQQGSEKRGPIFAEPLSYKFNNATGFTAWR